MHSLSDVQILRNVRVTTYPFTDYFQGFEHIEAVKQIFGDKTEEVLNNLKVEFYNGRSYMSFSDVDGHIRVNASYLNNGDITDLYLDVIHELVHLKQFMEGRKIFSENLIHVDRTLEIEACQHAVNEARRLDMSDEQIFEYLRTDRMSKENLSKLAKSLNVIVEMTPKKY